MLRKFVLASALVAALVPIQAAAVDEPNINPPAVCAEDVASFSSTLDLIKSGFENGEIYDYLVVEGVENVDGALLSLKDTVAEVGIEMDVSGLLGVADTAIFYWPTWAPILVLEGFVDGCSIGYVAWTYEELGIVVSEETPSS
jgi:hypothetical protein